MKGLTAKHKRVRWPTTLPKLPDASPVPYAKCRPELKDLDEGQITKLVIDSEAWAKVMVPILDKLDKRDVERSKSGPKRSYSAHEMEAVLVFQRVCGLASYKEARDRLASDRHGETRKLLGFELPRASANKVVRLTQGLPSEASVSRHRQRFGLKRRLGAYERLFRFLVEEHLEDPAMREEARILDLDGSHMLTHFNAPSPLSKNEDRPQAVTCPDGGWVPPSAATPWRTHGHGFNLVTLTTATGLPLAKRVTKIHHAERDAAITLLQGDYARHVAPKMEEDKVSVLTADVGLHSHRLRSAARDVGLVENIQLSSKADRDTSHKMVAKRNTMRIEIQDYPKWFANGHRELFCKCGQGSVSKVIGRKSGKAVVRSEGRCKTCGPITITSGRWSLAKNAAGPGLPRYRRWQDDGFDEADWLFGNPLTFNDPLSRAYGTARFGHQEGFHGHLVTRFGILRDKGWYRSRAQAELDVVATFCVMHVVAMEWRRRAATTPMIISSQAA